MIEKNTYDIGHVNECKLVHDLNGLRPRDISARDRFAGMLIKNQYDEPVSELVERCSANCPKKTLLGMGKSLCQSGLIQEVLQNHETTYEA